MNKKILTLVLLVTLFTGLYFFPGQAVSNYSKLQRVLLITGMDSEKGGLKSRLDRDLLVYGLPSDVPNNQWKTESEGVVTSWQNANGIDLGHPGKQEPRYIGYTFDGDLFASDYFPDDAPNHTAPAQRDMIKKPWDKYLASGENGDVSDYSWGLINRKLRD